MSGGKSREEVRAGRRLPRRIEEYKGAAPALSSEESFRQHILCQERLDRGEDDLYRQACFHQRGSPSILQEQEVIRRSGCRDHSALVERRFIVYIFAAIFVFDCS